MGRRILIDAGYEVITVNNGSAALKKIAESKPDLIIVDVYMPGYGGLEVCSRIKEAKETSRIPVLLTVGKLEPFKPEEARRVRADAFIVKPFEASELLTALTKLEDKIVPGPEPYKAGRFAKALASVERSSDKADSFGDTESGWKNRLTIPPPHMKSDHAQPELETPKPSGQVARELGREEDFKPAEPPKGFERPLPAGLPQDIRPEEIAAIAAAAAALRAGDVTQDASEGLDQPAAIEESKPVEAEAESSSAIQEPAKLEGPEEVRDEAQPVTQAENNSEAGPGVVAEPEKVASDAEVLAALASLTPANGDFSSEKREEEPVTVAVGAAAEAVALGGSYAGPRWIAEGIAVPIEEATRPLENEMHKCFAAFAAIDGSKMLLTALVEDGSLALSTAAPEDAAVQTKASENLTEAVETAMAAAAGAESAVLNISQQVSAPETGTETDAEPHREAELAAAWENWRHIRESIIDPETAPAIQEEATQPEESQVDRPAEAAGIGDTQPSEVKNEEVKAEDVKVEELKAEEAKVEEPQAAPAAEAATAIVDSNSLPDAKSDVMAAVQEVKTEAESEAADGSSDPEAIASIVDDMLADLKPKLMEELSKKLAKGKKKKKS
jgi:CheY-like chemotaxis protein